MGSPSSSNSSSPNSTLDRSQIALAGDCVDLVMNHMDSTRIFPGNIITHVDSDPKVILSYTFQGKIVIMDEIAVPIIQGAEVLLYMHNIDIPAVITKLISSSNRKESVEVQRPRVLIGGSTASVEIRVREKICVETYQDCRALGRFALRREGDTIAVGIVEKIK
jgi:elongation factor 1 alpha-like protein